MKTIFRNYFLGGFLRCTTCLIMIYRFLKYLYLYNDNCDEEQKKWPTHQLRSNSFNFKDKFIKKIASNGNKSLSMDIIKKTKSALVHFLNNLLNPNVPL